MAAIPSVELSSVRGEEIFEYNEEGLVEFDGIVNGQLEGKLKLQVGYGDRAFTDKVVYANFTGGKFKCWFPMKFAYPLPHLPARPTFPHIAKGKIEESNGKYRKLEDIKIRVKCTVLEAKADELMEKFIDEYKETVYKMMERQKSAMEANKRASKIQKEIVELQEVHDQLDELCPLQKELIRMEIEEKQALVDELHEEESKNNEVVSETDHEMRNKLGELYDEQMWLVFKLNAAEGKEGESS